MVSGTLTVAVIAYASDNRTALLPFGGLADLAPCRKFAVGACFASRVPRVEIREFVGLFAVLPSARPANPATPHAFRTPEIRNSYAAALTCCPASPSHGLCFTPGYGPPPTGPVERVYTLRPPGPSHPVPPLDHLPPLTRSML